MMLSQYGGSEGLRDDNLLESALAKPRQHFAYGKLKDLFHRLGGWYFFHQVIEKP